MINDEKNYQHFVNGIEFSLKEKIDTSTLSKLGHIFAVFDKNDSGNISFGVQRGQQRLFCKIAGYDTINSVVTKEQAIHKLKKSAEIHKAIKHPCLIEMQSLYKLDNVYVAEYPWITGDCLFDHWNFDLYEKNNQLSPIARFRKLPIQKKRRVFDEIVLFMKHVNDMGYVAIDFYDSSLIYDFESEKIHVCDVDFFEKMHYKNINGFIWGSNRFKAPEEYIVGSVLDQRTDVYHLAIFATIFFGNNLNECQLTNWELSEHEYRVVMKALSAEPMDRYKNIGVFINEFNKH